MLAERAQALELQDLTAACSALAALGLALPAVSVAPIAGAVQQRLRGITEWSPHHSQVMYCYCLATASCGGMHMLFTIA